MIAPTSGSVHDQEEKRSVSVAVPIQGVEARVLTGTDHVTTPLIVPREQPPEPQSVLSSGTTAPISPAARQVHGTSTFQDNLAQRPADIRDAARALAGEFTAQVEELKRSIPNEQDRLAQHDALITFFEKMAAGLTALADALDRAVNGRTSGTPEPVFLGRAAEAARQLQIGALEFLEEHRATVVEVPVRIGLFGLGMAFVHSLGIDGTAVTAAIAALALKRAPKKSARRKTTPRK